MTIESELARLEEIRPTVIAKLQDFADALEAEAQVLDAAAIAVDEAETLAELEDAIGAAGLALDRQRPKVEQLLGSAKPNPFEAHFQEAHTAVAALSSCQLALHNLGGELPVEEE